MLNRQSCFIVLAPFHQCLSRPHHQLQMEIRARVHACAESRGGSLISGRKSGFVCCESRLWNLTSSCRQLINTFYHYANRLHIHLRGTIYGELGEGSPAAHLWSAIEYDVCVGERAKWCCQQLEFAVSYTRRETMGRRIRTKNSPWDKVFSARNQKNVFRQVS